MQISTLHSSVKKGQKVKFVVSSAEEAVNLIRQEMGPEAKVLSVRQVEGKGLAKFLTAPRLEIIAAMPEEEGQGNASVQNSSASSSLSGLSSEDKELLETPSVRPLVPSKRTGNGGVDVVDESRRNFCGNSHVANPAANVVAAASSNKLESVLRAAGFESSIIRRFENSTDWEKLQRIPLRTALGDLARRLRMDYDALKIPATSQTIAFIGASGVGKTTALCKQLSHEVFFERRSVQVLKLDGGQPNADTALGLYCEVMGVPMIRDAKLIDPTHALLVDTTGLTLNDPEEIAALKRQLDSLGIKTRAWVVNAAYDNSVIDRSLAIAEELGATHSVYTHLDELSSTNRLWHFVLSGRLPPLFGSTGPGIAHDRSADLGGTLLQKTFPEYLLK